MIGKFVFTISSNAMDTIALLETIKTFFIPSLEMCEESRDDNYMYPANCGLTFKALSKTVADDILFHFILFIFFFFKEK